jgi:hypothetical protein
MRPKEQIRLAHPRRLRLYWIEDNRSCHWTPAIRTWAAANHVELVQQCYERPLLKGRLRRLVSQAGWRGRRNDCSAWSCSRQIRLGAIGRKCLVDVGATRATDAQAGWGYLISVSILNIGRYMLMMITPTIRPTPIIISGSMIEVSDWIAASTSSS